MNFLQKIKNSIYNPAFYANLKEQKLSFSFRYFFSLAGLLALIAAFVFGVEMSPLFSGENLKKLVDYYPKELNIEVKGGTISTNVSEPYIIKGPTGFSSREESRSENIIVIDTKNDFTVEAFRAHATEVLLGKNFVVVSKGRGQFEFSDLSGIPDFNLNQERLIGFASVIGEHHLALSLLLFVILFFSFFGLFTLKLFILLFLAVLILCVVKLKKVLLNYKQCYQIALHAVTIPLIFETFFIVSGVGALSLFIFILIALIVVSVNIKSSGVVLS